MNIFNQKNIGHLNVIHSHLKRKKIKIKTVPKLMKLKGIMKFAKRCFVKLPLFLCVVVVDIVVGRGISNFNVPERFLEIF